MWQKDVTITKNGYYRVWIGLRLPMGEYNKMYNYTIEQALDSFKLKEQSNSAYKELLENTGNNNENSNLQQKQLYLLLQGQDLGKKSWPRV